MPTLFITEYNHVDRSDVVSAPPVAQQPALVDQVVTITGASAASATFNSNTSLVCVSTDIICSIKFGTAPTATTTTARLPADSVQYYLVPRGAGFKVAVIANT